MGVITRIIWKTTLAAIILIASIVVSPARASVVTQANDYPTSLEAGAVANHRLLFTTPSGVSEGEVISLQFSSDFTVVLTEDDVDIADDSVDLSTASDCTGVEDAGVSIAGTTVSITICPGDGGAIAATSVVTIEIGTNATFSGTGSSQIENPASVGTYFISIGSFGDFGSIALPIQSIGGVTVFADVPDQAGGGAPVVVAPQDRTAPVVSNILISNVTASQAQITWDTDEPAKSSVDYGLTQAFGTTLSVDNYFQVHSVVLNNLEEGKKYFFRIRATDASGNVRTSATLTFTTLDQTSPVIADVLVSNIAPTTAKVTWTTNESSTSKVEYGTTLAYGKQVTLDALALNHSINLIGLTAETTYHMRVVSVDASGNIATSNDATFVTTADAPPSNVSSFKVVEGDGQLVLSWVNPAENDFAGVRVRMCPIAFPVSLNDAACQTVFDGLAATFTHSGLVNNTTYYYGVFAYDQAGQFSSGALGSGAPKAPEIEEPVNIPFDQFDPEDVPLENPVAPQEGQQGAGNQEEGSPLGAAVPLKLDLSDLSFVVAKQIQLSYSAFQTMDVLGNQPLRVWVPASELEANLKSVTFSIGDQAYIMRLSEDAKNYQTDVLTPSEVKSYLFELKTVSTESHEESVSSILRVINNGHVSGIIDGEEAWIKDVSVLLSEMVGGALVVWDGSPYGQFNPQVSLDGSYSFTVPNGSYVVHITAQGYQTFDSTPIEVTNHFVNSSFLLTAYLPPKEEAPVTTPVLSSESVSSDVLSRSLEYLRAAETALDDVRTLPVVQTTTNVAIPTLAVTAGASVVLMTLAFDFLPLMQYLFTAPVLLFGRKKRKEYGVVYHANTKIPVDLAVVRLHRYDAQKPNGLGVLVSSRVTDKAGRFFFLAQPGQYKLVVSKRSFLFPALSVQQLKEDGDYLDIYHGEPLTVTDKNAMISPNIPMDPKDSAHDLTPSRVVWKRRVRLIQNVVAVSGILVSLAVAILRPSVLTLSMIALQAVIYSLFQRLSKPPRPKNWGIVYDKQTNRPLGNVVARIFEPTYNKLLDMQVSDSKGRYAFLLGSGGYYAVFEKPGYRQTQVRPIQVNAKQDASPFSMNVELYKE